MATAPGADKLTGRAVVRGFVCLLSVVLGLVILIVVVGVVFRVFFEMSSEGKVLVDTPEVLRGVVV